MTVQHEETAQKVIILESGNNHLSLDAKEPPRQIDADVRDPVYCTVRGGVFLLAGPIQRLGAYMFVRQHRSEFNGSNLAGRRHHTRLMDFALLGRTDKRHHQRRAGRFHESSAVHGCLP